MGCFQGRGDKASVDIGMRWLLDLDAALATGHADGLLLGFFIIRVGLVHDQFQLLIRQGTIRSVDIHAPRSPIVYVVELHLRNHGV